MAANYDDCKLKSKNGLSKTKGYYSKFNVEKYE
jgi:hypothetical protein